MQEMVASGEANHLVPERVWKEFSRALAEPHPELFLEGLLRLGLTRLRGFAAYKAVNAESVALAQSAAFAPASLEVKAVVATNMDAHALPNIKTPAVSIPSGVWRLARLTHAAPKPPGMDSTEWYGVLHRSGDMAPDLFSAWELRGWPLGPAREVLQAYQAVDTKSISASLPAGPQVGQAIAQARIRAIEQILSLVRA